MNVKKTAFTTSQIAKICHVSRDTAKRWVEKGIIKGYRVGTSGHWRVLPDDLAFFLKANNIPFPDPKETGIDLKKLGNSENLATFCWEFHKKRNDHVRREEMCEDCLVYKVRSIKCYALREEGEHKRIHCNHSCDTCAYFRFLKQEVLPKI